MNHRFFTAILKYPVLIGLLCLALPVRSESPERKWVVPFTEDVPFQLENLQRLDRLNSRYGLKTPRLLLKDGTSGKAVLHLDDRAGIRFFRGVMLRTLSHGGLKAPIPNRLTVSVSGDGRNWTRLSLEQTGKPISFPGGYSLTSFQARCPDPCRSIMLELHDVAGNWQLQLAELILSEEVPAAVEKQLEISSQSPGKAPEKASPERTKVLSPRRMFIAFSEEVPLKLEHMQRLGWRSSMYGLKTPRLGLKNAETGKMTLDLANLKGLERFQGVTLSTLSHNGLKTPIPNHLTAFASNDGRHWTGLNLEQLGEPEPRAGGYSLSVFQARCSEPYRLISFEIHGIPADQYWLLQLAELTLNGDGIEEKQPEGRRLESSTPALGARIFMKIHTAGIGQLKWTARTGDRELSPRWRDGKADGGGWRERIIEVWSDEPFRTLDVNAATDPGWAAKIERVEFITDRKADEEKHLGPVPAFRLNPDERRCRIDRVYASYLQEKSMVESDDFSRVKWGASPLPEAGAKVRSWNDLTILQGPGEILAALYRFRVTAAFDPAREEIRLVLPKSSFVTTVYADGRKIGSSNEGFLPVSFPLDGTLLPGRESEFVVKVANYRSAIDAQHKTLFPIGSMFRYTNGMTQPPILERRTRLRAGDLFIQSYPGKLTVEAEVVNHTAAARSGTAEVIITGTDGGELLRGKTRFRAEAGKSAEITLDIPVDDKLKRWDVGEPNLYFARIELDDGGGKIVSDPVRFGYRTVEIRGADLYLNDRKIRLKGPWAHIGEWTYRRAWKGGRLDDRGLYRTLLAHGINSGRLHCQPFEPGFYDAADEAGFLLIAESALNHRPANQAALDHIDRFVRTMRNHPSIVIWSGSNEFEHWITPRPEKTMDFMLEVQKHIKAQDPTRPVMHSGFGDARGKLDIYNIHYPADRDGLPRTLYWTRNPAILPNRFYRQNFTAYNPVGRKPLAYGEERIPVNDIDLSMLFGEDALRARLANTPEGIKRTQQMLARDWVFRTRAEREQNVLLICPNIFYLGLESEFLRLLAEEFRPAGVYPKFRNPVLEAGKKATFPVVFFEDSGKPFSGTVRIELKSDGGILAQTQMPFESKGGTLTETDVALEIPDLPSPKKSATLVTRTFDAGGKEVFHDESDFLIMRQPGLKPFDKALYVWGTPGPLAAFAGKCGLKLEPIATPEPLRKVEHPVLWIAPDVTDDDLRKHAGTLAGLVDGGARVILSERVRDNMSLPSDGIWNGNPEALSCIGFVRNARHPVTEGINDLELRYWENDYLLTAGMTGKPESGNFRILIDGDPNCSSAFLWELPHGRGSYLVNHLRLLENAAKLPQAAELLHRLLAYAFSSGPESLTPGALLGADTDFTAGILRDLGWVPVGSESGTQTLAVTGEAIGRLGVARVAEIAGAYRNVVLFNVPRKDVESLTAALTGNTLKTGDAKLNSTDRFHFTGSDPLYCGMTSADLNWGMKRIELPYGFEAEKPFLSGIGHGADAFFRKPDGGAVLFLNLPFDRDVPAAGTRNRFLSQLSTNLGVRLDAKPVKNYDSSAVRDIPVDLGEVANASRENYFGKPFPSGNVEFCNVPFRLPAGSEAKKENLLRFSGRNHFSGKPEFDTPIDRFTGKAPDQVLLPLNRIQAESIFFLQAATHNWKLNRFGSGRQVGEYRIHFTDGTCARIGLSYGVNIGCVRGSSSPIPRAKLAGTWQMPPNGDGETSAAFVLEWENPTPEKKITGIEIVNGGNAPHDLIVFAVTIREPVLQYQ